MLTKMTIRWRRRSNPSADSSDQDDACWRRQLLLGLFLSSAILISTGPGHQLRAQPQTAKIVGLGATTCQRFNEHVRSNPAVRRDYLAWTQGFMSGILLSRPPGIDEGLDLTPPSFGLPRQLRFLEEYCARNSSQDFADAVEALYKRLREEEKT